jgi:hypothetical protein
VNSAYSLFGLSVSSNLPIAGLSQCALALPFTSGSDPDIEVHLGALPQSMGLLVAGAPGEIAYASPELNASGQPLVRICRISAGALFRVEFDDGAQFWLDSGARHVWCVWQPPLSVDDAISYLLGPILGLVLRLRGVACLHSSAVSLGGRAVAFVGPGGAGKSTTAAAFAARGQAVLSDDIVALIERDNAFHALPAYPHLCLWSDSVTAIFGSPDAVPCFSPSWDKRRVALGNPQLSFETRTLPLSYIFLLGERRPSDGAEPAASELLSPREAFVALVANSYATNALDSESRAKELEILGRLVSSVPVRRIHADPGSGRLSEFCEFVVRTAAASPSPGGAAVSKP